MNEKQAATVTESEIFDYHDLSLYLKIPEGTLRHWKIEGRIPYSMFGSHVRFPKCVIDEWLLNNTFLGGKRYETRMMTSGVCSGFDRELPLFGNGEEAGIDAGESEKAD
jgi:excisionase family DNA binding protein